MSATATATLRRSPLTVAVTFLALVAAALVGLAAPPARADWNPATNLATPGQRIIGAAQVAYDASGRGYAVWTDYGPYPSDDRVWLRERPAGGPWGPAQLLPTAGTGYVRSLDLAVNDAGDLVLAWYGNGITAIRRPAGGTWGPQKTWSSPGTAGPGSGCPNAPQVSVGPDGTVLVGWTSYQSCNGNVSQWRVMTATWSSAAGWQASPTVFSISTVDAHSQPSVSVGAGGALLMALSARNSSQNDELWTVEGTVADGWSAPVRRSGNASYQGQNVAQRGGVAVVSWYGSFGAYALVRSGGSWGAAQQLPVSGAQPDHVPPSVAVDGTGHALVAVNSPQGGSWTSHLLTSSSGGPFSDEVIATDNAVDPQIAVNAAGDVAATYELLAGGGATAYAVLRPAGEDWGATQQVSNAASVNGGSSQPQVAIDPFGHVLAIATPMSAGFGTEVDVTLEARDPATPPPPTQPVTISPGTAFAGDTVTCDPAGFGGTGPFRYTYQWAVEGTPVAGETGSSYVVKRSDARQGLTCTVDAANEAGTATSTSEALVVGSTAPAFTSGTTLTGAVQAGSTVTCVPGTVTGAPDPDLGYTWLRNGSALPFETTSTYDVTLADGGSSLVCRVTATNDAGSAVSLSPGSTVPVPVGPKNKTLPTISGPATAGVGSALTCSTGTWTGSPAPTYAFYWTRDGVQAPGGYGAGYTVQPGDAGTTLRCQVSATNAAGDVTVTSKDQRVVSPPPLNTQLPVVKAATGSTWSVGGTAQCTSGSWKYATGYAYQWLRDGNPVAGAVQATRTITAADAGTSLACVVTATGPSGSASAVSAGKAVASGPTLVSAPTISGIARPGKVLTCNRGTWSNAASFAYAWQRNGTTVVGQTTNKLTLAAGDVGATITCTVTATGPGGTTSATTAGVLIGP